MQDATSHHNLIYKHCRLANEGLVNLNEMQSTNTPDVSHYSVNVQKDVFTPWSIEYVHNTQFVQSNRC